MSDGLREELQEIRGVGDAKADQIMELVEQSEAYSKTVESAEEYSKVVEQVAHYEGVCRDALELLEDGHASHAESYLRGVLEGD